MALAQASRWRSRGLATFSHRLPHRERGRTAQFLWVAAGDALPPLASLNLGSDADPELSTTVVLEVAGWQGGNPLQWRGPGVAGERTLAVQGLPDTFLPQWHNSHAAFPRGVDLLLASAEHIVGLPRSCQLSRAPQPQEA